VTGPARADLLRKVRDTLPPRLNTGILMGDGGFCVLGWMLTVAGYHPITLYNSTLFVNDPDPARGGPAVDVVARVYGLAPEEVAALGRANDETPTDGRVGAVRDVLDALVPTGAP